MKTYSYVHQNIHLLSFYQYPLPILQQDHISVAGFLILRKICFELDTQQRSPVLAFGPKSKA